MASILSAEHDPVQKFVNSLNACPGCDTAEEMAEQARQFMTASNVVELGVMQTDGVARTYCVPRDPILGGSRAVRLEGAALILNEKLTDDPLRCGRACALGGVSEIFVAIQKAANNHRADIQSRARGLSVRPQVIPEDTRDYLERLLDELLPRG